jgi:hypothetical protein
MPDQVNHHRRNLLGGATASVVAAHLGLAPAVHASPNPAGPAAKPATLEPIKQIRAGELDVGYYEAGPADVPGPVATEMLDRFVGGSEEAKAGFLSTVPAGAPPASKRSPRNHRISRQRQGALPHRGVHLDRWRLHGAMTRRPHLRPPNFFNRIS